MPKCVGGRRAGALPRTPLGERRPSHRPHNRLGKGTPLPMGVDHGETGGHVPPEFKVGGGAIMQIVPRRFCHISTKMSVMWPSKTLKSVFGRGSAQDPAGGAHDAPQTP